MRSWDLDKAGCGSCACVWVLVGVVGVGCAGCNICECSCCGVCQEDCRPVHCEIAGVHVMAKPDRGGLAGTSLWTGTWMAVKHDPSYDSFCSECPELTAFSNARPRQPWSLTKFARQPQCPSSMVPQSRSDSIGIADIMHPLGNSSGKYLDPAAGKGPKILPLHNLVIPA